MEKEYKNSSDEHSPNHAQSRGPLPPVAGLSTIGLNKGKVIPRVRFAPPLDARELSKLGTKSGYLKKQADNEPGRWNEYFFIIKPTSYLYYYNSREDEVPRGIIDLEFLQDVRLNIDCVQRSVGGSEHSFRVTGQLPKSCRIKTDRPKLRPLYLDSETPSEAEDWMDAILNHRFDFQADVEMTRMHEKIASHNQVLEGLHADTATIYQLAKSLTRTAKELLADIRGGDLLVDETIETMDTLKFMDHTQLHASLITIMSDLGTLLDDFHAEAKQQAKQIVNFRERQVEREVKNKAKLATLMKKLKESELAKHRLQRTHEEELLAMKIRAKKDQNKTSVRNLLGVNKKLKTKSLKRGNVAKSQTDGEFESTDDEPNTSIDVVSDDAVSMARSRKSKLLKSKMAAFEARHSALPLMSNSGQGQRKADPTSSAAFPGSISERSYNTTKLKPVSTPRTPPAHNEHALDDDIGIHSKISYNSCKESVSSLELDPSLVRKKKPKSVVEVSTPVGTSKNALSAFIATHPPAARIHKDKTQTKNSVKSVHESVSHVASSHASESMPASENTLTNPKEYVGRKDANIQLANQLSATNPLSAFLAAHPMPSYSPNNETEPELLAQSDDVKMSEDQDQHKIRVPYTDDNRGYQSDHAKNPSQSCSTNNSNFEEKPVEVEDSITSKEFDVDLPKMALTNENDIEPRPEDGSVEEGAFTSERVANNSSETKTIIYTEAALNANAELNSSLYEGPNIRAIVQSETNFTADTEKQACPEARFSEEAKMVGGIINIEEHEGFVEQKTAENTLYNLKVVSEDDNISSERTKSRILHQAKSPEEVHSDANHHASPIKTIQSNELPIVPLPKGWSMHESRSRPNEFYYVNDYTGETSWDIPKDEAVPPVVEVADDESEADSDDSYGDPRADQRGGSNVSSSVGGYSDLMYSPNFDEILSDMDERESSITTSTSVKKSKSRWKPSTGGILKKIPKPKKRNLLPRKKKRVSDASLPEVSVITEPNPYADEAAFAAAGAVKKKKKNMVQKGLGGLKKKVSRPRRFRKVASPLCPPPISPENFEFELDSRRHLF